MSTSFWFNPEAGMAVRWGGGAVARASLLDDRGGMPVLQRPTALDA